MAITLALFEIGSFFTVACLLFLSSNPAGALWPDGVPLLTQAVAVTAACLISFYYNDLYDLKIVRSLTDFIPRLLSGFAIAFFILAAFYFLFPSQGVDARAFLTLQVLMALLIVGGRWVCYRALQNPRFSEKVLVLGESMLSAKIVRELADAPLLRYTIPGIVTDRPYREDDGRTAYAPVLGPIEDVADIIQEHRPDRVVVALGERRGRLPVWGLLASCLRGVSVEDGIEFYERITRKLAVESLNPSYLLFSKDFKKPKLQIVLRRLVSLTFALVGLVVTLPLMLVIAALVKLDSKGPALFIQERAGLDGKIFRLFKFRTMHEVEKKEPSDSDSIWHRENEARVTRIGKWLRATRLDELPQFVNILKGDMDIVGPRPEMASNVPDMLATIPYYGLRTAVRPGVTGWAQIKCGYALTQEEVKEKLRYDLYYVKNMSLALDLRILLDTVKTVLFSRGT